MDINGEKLCRICLKESLFHSNIYNEQLLDGRQLLEVMNDLMQLEVEFEDGFPQYLCSECFRKISEFEQFKRIAHEGKAILLSSRDSFENFLDTVEIIKDESVCKRTDAAENVIVSEDTKDDRGFVAVQNEVYLVPTEMDNYESDPLSRDPLEVDIRNEIEDPLHVEEDPRDKGHEMNLKVSNYLICIPEGGMPNSGAVRNDKHIKINVPNEGRGKKLLGQKKLDQKLLRVENNDIAQDATRGCGGESVNSDTVNLNDNENRGGVEYKGSKCDDAFTGSFSSNTSDIKHLKDQRPVEEAGNSKNIYQKSPQYFLILKRTNSASVKKQEIGKLYFCDLCQKAFSSKFKLGCHIRVHTGDRPFKCTMCDKAFTQKGNLSRHVILHNTDAPNVCHQCGKLFDQNSSLTEHMKTHSSTRKYYCEVCSKSFTSKSLLVVHMKFHGDYKSFFCNNCGMSFKYETTFKKHLASHDDEMPFHCDMCGKGFLVKDAMKRHRSRHISNRPFSCDKCDKSFKTKGELLSHMTVHSGLKAFKCSVCAKKFGSKSTLRSHMQTHSTERPFPCPHCGKCFKYVSNVNWHSKYACKKRLDAT